MKKKNNNIPLMGSLTTSYSLAALIPDDDGEILGVANFLSTTASSSMVTSNIHKKLKEKRYTDSYIDSVSTEELEEGIVLLNEQVNTINKPLQKIYKKSK